MQEFKLTLKYKEKHSCAERVFAERLPGGGGPIRPSRKLARMREKDKEELVSGTFVGCMPSARGFAPVALKSPIHARRMLQRFPR